MPDQNEQETAPKMSDSLRQGEKHPNPISDSPAGKLLSNFVVSMNQFGDNAQEVYEEALEAMRKRAGEVIVEIARALGNCHPDNYPFRWALIHAAAELRHPAAIPLLRNLVLTPIPAERSENPHSFSTVAEETILRTTAVEGMEFLATKGDEKEAVVENIFEFLKLPSLSVRRASVQALLVIDDSKKQRDRIARLLPDDQRFLLDIKRTKVEEVPQIEEPQRHLREAAKQIEKESPPRIPGESENDAPKVY